MLRRYVFALGQAKELANRVFRFVRLLADDAEVIPAAANFNVETRFDEPQIFIQRPAQLGQSRVIGRLEVEFAL